MILFLVELCTLPFCSSADCKHPQGEWSTDSFWTISKEKKRHYRLEHEPLRTETQVMHCCIRGRKFVAREISTCELFVNCGLLYCAGGCDCGKQANQNIRQPRTERRERKAERKGNMEVAMCVSIIVIVIPDSCYILNSFNLSS